MVKKILLTLSLLFLFSIGLELPGCQGDPMPMCYINGTVTDSISGEAIDSAQIIANDTINSLDIFYTDSLGNYKSSFTYDDNIIEVYCMKDGYYTKKTTIRLFLKP